MDSSLNVIFLLSTAQVNSAFRAPLYAGSEVISKTYNLRIAEETKSHVSNFISDHYLVYWQE